MKYVYIPVQGYQGTYSDVCVCVSGKKLLNLDNLHKTHLNVEHLNRQGYCRVDYFKTVGK